MLFCVFPQSFSCCPFTIPIRLTALIHINQKKRKGMSHCPHRGKISWKIREKCRFFRKSCLNSNGFPLFLNRISTFLRNFSRIWMSYTQRTMAKPCEVGKFVTNSSEVTRLRTKNRKETSSGSSCPEVSLSSGSVLFRFCMLLQPSYCYLWYR